MVQSVGRRVEWAEYITLATGSGFETKETIETSGI